MKFCSLVQPNSQDRSHFTFRIVAIAPYYTLRIFALALGYKYTRSGENLKGENVGESPLMKQIDIGKEKFEHHSSNSPKFSHFKIVPCTDGSRTASMHDCLIRIYHLMQ